MFIFIDTFFIFFIVMNNPVASPGFASDLGLPQQPNISSSGPSLAPSSGKPPKKKRGKNVLLEQMRTNTDLQVQNNELLRQLVEQFGTFLELKRRELELKEESINCKRKRSS
jgi:hypothetical protein